MFGEADRHSFRRPELVALATYFHECVMGGWVEGGRVGWWVDGWMDGWMDWLIDPLSG